MSKEQVAVVDKNDSVIGIKVREALTQKVRNDVQRVYEIVNNDTKLREIDEHERAALSLQVDHLEK